MVGQLNPDPLPHQRRAARYSRAHFLSTLGLLGAGALVGLPTGLGSSRLRAAPSLPEASTRALNAYAALCRHFADGELFWDDYPRQRGRDDVIISAWPHAIVNSATLDVAAMPQVGDAFASDVASRVAALRNYSTEKAAIVRDGYDPLPVRYSADREEKYNDDNAWIGLNLMRAANSPSLDGEARRTYAEQADAVLQFILRSQTRGADGRPGGVYWKRQQPREQNHDVSTVSSAPTGELALQLYARWGRSPYLERAKELHAWVNAALGDQDHLYWDNIHGDGQVDRTKYTYNQGSMIGLGALLAGATGQRAYLRGAENTARAVLARWHAGGFAADTPEFDYILFKNLLYLSSQTDDGDLRQKIHDTLASHAERLWGDPALHDRDGLFHFGGDTVKVIHQAAVTGMLALSAWELPNYRLLF